MRVLVGVAEKELQLADMFNCIKMRECKRRNN